MARWFLFSIASLSAAFAFPADASSFVAHETPELRIGISAQSAPYILDMEARTGIDPEIIGTVVTQMGYRAIFFRVPFRRHAALMKEQKLDAISLWTVPEGLNCYLTRPYRYWRNALFIAGDTVGTANDLAALNGLRVGIFEGADDLSGRLASLGLTTPLQTISSTATAAKMLQYGRLDAYIGDYPSVEFALREPGPESAKPVKMAQLVSAVPQSLCFLDDRMRAAFDRALEATTADGGKTLANIPARYGLMEKITPPLTAPAP